MIWACSSDMGCPAGRAGAGADAPGRAPATGGALVGAGLVAVGRA